MQSSRLVRIKLLLILISLVGLLSPASSLLSGPGDSVTIDGVTYQVLELMSTNGESATLYTDRGPLLVKWTDLPPGVRQRFAKAFSEALDRASATAIAAYGESIAIEGTVLAKVKEGSIVDWNNRRILLFSVQNDESSVGTKISVISKRAGTAQVEGAGGKSLTLRAYRVIQVR